MVIKGAISPAGLHSKMKEILAGWLVLQLLIVGTAGGKMLVNIKNDCPSEITLQESLKRTSEFKIYIVSTLVPIVWFTPELKTNCQNIK